MPSARQLKVAEPSFVVPIWCYALVNNWEFRLKRRMNLSDVILFIVSEDLCPTTHQAFADWPVFTFCRCHFPLGYWCASLPRKSVLSMHFVKLTPWAHTSFCCTVGEEECLWRGTLNISVIFCLEKQERQTGILLHILLIQMIPGSWFCSQKRQSSVLPYDQEPFFAYYLTSDLRWPKWKQTIIDYPTANENLYH